MPEIETLFDWMWKVTVVLTCGCALAAMLRSAAERHMAYLLTVAACLLVAVVVLLPVAPLPAPVEVSIPAMRTIAIPAFSAPDETAQTNSLALLMLLWAVGTVGLLAYALLGRALLSLWSRRAMKPAPGQLVDAAASVGAELGIRRPVKVLVSDGSASPMTWGILRPVILLPQAWQGWAADRLRVVLIHELGHVKRWDSLSQMLAACATALYWPHPLIWLVAQRLRQQQEKACDDLVLNRGYSAPSYAEHLIGIASGAGKPPASAIAMAQPSTLEARIVAALDPSRSRRSPQRTLAIAASVLLVGLALTGAGVRLMGQAGGARLDGSVLDPSGAAIPGAEIVVSFEGGKRKEITRSGADGTYSFASLPAGVYTIEVRARGFAVLSMPEVRLQDNQPRTLPLRLDVGRITETIQVVGKKPEISAPHAATTPQRIRVGGSVQATKLLRMVKPPYPEELQQAGVEGTVLLRGVISTSGKLLSLESMNSLVDARLTKTAIDAVSRWEYQPTLLNGQPVEVITTITVNFQLAP